MMRRMPKRGFNNNQFREGFLSVNLGRVVTHFSSGAAVDPAGLIAAGLIPQRKGIVKVLGVGEISHALHFKGVAASESAKAKILAAGGSVE